MTFPAMLSELYDAFRRKVGGDEPPAKAAAEAVVIENARFRSIDGKFDALSHTIDQRFDALSQRFDVLNQPRERLPATTCQRSARASCYGVRSQFWTRGRDTYSAWLQCQPSRSRPGHQTHQTYDARFDISEALQPVGRLLRAAGSKWCPQTPRAACYEVASVAVHRISARPAVGPPIDGSDLATTARGAS